MTLSAGPLPGAATAPARGPVSAVLHALQQGAGTVDELSRVTALERDVVRNAIDQLLRLGRLDATSVPLGCGSGGSCGSCAAACGPAAPATPYRPGGSAGLVALSLRART